ncbi:MAG TPA: nicotianamine synthase family protein [Kineosporiaceae bacterium]
MYLHTDAGLMGSTPTRRLDAPVAAQLARDGDPAPGRALLPDRIARLYRHLRDLESLAPAPGVNRLFGELVNVCVRTDQSAAPTVLADPRVQQLLPDLLRICAEGESLLEQAWAHRVIGSADPWAELAQFPYLDNYQQLTRLEPHALAGAGHRRQQSRRVCFLGGGPLPLTAVLMHAELGTPVDVVDNRPEAVDLARRVIGRLAPGPGIRAVRADAAAADDMRRTLAGCDVVVLAALVGCTRQQKQVVLSAVGGALEAGAYLVVRSTHGLRSLLYPVVDVGDVARVAGCLPEVLVHPLGDVVNSVLVARRR